MSTKEAKGFFTAADSLRRQTAALIREDEKMKTWTMPKVEIDGFSANEYVAACSTVIPFQSSDYLACDFGREINDGYSFEPTPNGVFDSNASEAWNAQTTTAESLIIHSGHTGWYRGKTVYRRLQVGTASNTPYSDTSYFSPLDGLYDIYITRTGHNVYVYKQGEAPLEDPTSTKNFS